MSIQNFVRRRLHFVLLGLIPVAHLSAAPAPLTAFSGAPAVASLQQNGSYHSLQEAFAAVRQPDATPPLFSFEAKLTSPAVASNGDFGTTVSLSGQTAVVGDRRETINGGANYGAAYVFIRNGTTWSLQQKLIASDGAAGAFFGSSVAIDGNTLIVGAGGASNAGGGQGAAYIFVRSGTVWSQQQKLSASDGAAGDFFGGESVAITGSTAVVGVPDRDNGAVRDQGAAYVFVRTGVSWSQQQKLLASDGGSDDRFGVRVAIERDTIVVGAHFETLGAGFGHGAAYVYVRSGTSWSQQQKLVASDAITNAEFGGAVAISGETIMIGAPFDRNRGAAYIFVRSGVSWSQQQKLLASNSAIGNLFGWSVALQGDNAIAGDPGSNTNTGSFYYFSRSGITWSQIQQVFATDPMTNAGFGAGASISGNTAIIGANGTTTNTQGAAYVFTLPPTAATPSTFSPLSPARVWDSRVGPGPVGEIGPGQTRDVTVTGIGGVPTAGVTAVVLNVVAINPTAQTFVTAWPTGEAQPLAANLNVPAGDVRPNLVIVKVGVGGQVSIYNNSGSANFVADVAGWYGPGATERYTPVSPARLWDTRFGPGPTGRIEAGGSRNVVVTGVGGVPATGVTAVVLNVAAVNPSAQTFLTAWPAGETRPLAANLNIPAGDVRPNLVIVKVGAGGMVSFFNNAGDIDVVADVAGYFGSTGSRFNSVSPSRTWDTRVGPGPIGRIAAGGSRSVTVTGLGGVPATGVTAVVLNVVAVRPTAQTFLTAWPTGEARPLAANLNVPVNDVRANLVIVKVGTGGQVDFYNNAGDVDVVADVAGWFGPPGE